MPCATKHWCFLWKTLNLHTRFALSYLLCDRIPLLSLRCRGRTHGDAEFLNQLFRRIHRCCRRRHLQQTFITHFGKTVVMQSRVFFFTPQWLKNALFRKTAISKSKKYTEVVWVVKSFCCWERSFLYKWEVAVFLRIQLKSSLTSWI